MVHQVGFCLHDYIEMQGQQNVNKKNSAHLIARFVPCFNVNKVRIFKRAR